jgi:chromosome segregation ATPase
MEIDELEKRIDWLDSERQKDKKLIAELSDEIAAIRDVFADQGRRIISSESEVKAIKKAATRAEKVDADFAEYKTEVLKQIADFGKKVDAVENKLEKERKDDADSFNKRLLEYQSDIKVIAEIKKNVQLRAEDVLLLNQKIDEVAKSLSAQQGADADLQRQQRSFINDLSIENKRLADVQVETGALRKRIEEDRSIVDVNKELIRKLESRVNEIQNAEMERRQNQTAFIEKQNLLQVERENLWKEWQARFTSIEGLGASFSAQLLSLEETHRAVNQAKQEFEEINERFTRRINEITEMNRLSEERFRQEWVAFKADDQKRWTNYTLSHEEEQHESDRQQNRVADRLVALEDSSQELNDTVHLINEETQKQMRGLLSLTQELLDSYTQAVGKRVK